MAFYLRYRIWALIIDWRGRFGWHLWSLYSTISDVHDATAAQVLTVGDEILYMWRGRFVWTRMLFWLTSVEHMLYAVDRTGIGPLATTNVTDVPVRILILRLYVIYRCNRKLLLILCTLFAAELSIECVLLVKIFNNLKRTLTTS
ncbi:hypothetical protein IEO21_08038 [Rhodonia placenta]|uniref:Uncharacterized protein n=2 Tax=Rhodonia placenta TaxID=104341 RepID=A0A1X6N0P9_9APHY|nr:hypothetical protein POSPLADRAFT_1142533 [Postia placenta MAD-698-R-SB12]KAF9807899.1 hypothetical protein IEO21_08038 [Postia placenta]OSX62187.1 hypothetical protein POSPLADRAFT_1142533 [Postia placenta MAD-698-R-SB12]